MNRNQFDEALKKLDSAPVTKKVLRLVLASDTNAEIAQSRGKSEGTIRKQVSNLYERFGIARQFTDDPNFQRRELKTLFKKYKPEWLSEKAIAKPNQESEEIVGTSASEPSPEQVVLDQSQPNHSLPDQEKNTPDASYLIAANSFLDDFSKAIDQLESKHIHVRIGAISSLGKLAKFSRPEDHWTVMEYLAAFIRNAPPRREAGIPDDIQEALTVIGRRDIEKDPENQRLDLNKVNIAGANLREAQLQGVNFEHANLQGAILKKANLKKASFYNTNLQGAHLWKAYFQEANFMEANLQGAILSNATMQKAKLWGTKLQGASLTIANLEEADLSQADLNRANLQGANFMGAKLQEVNFAESNLQGTKLQGADLTNAKNLDSQEISSAYGDSRTILPEDVVRPAHWK
ncbi:pentapeptide repeat-containing protein [Coleofasciculus sp. E2-BRE-01]|uniref:pentapeptide repeat-containing protein n=1 Tax=Coleofasciculus sp. E2-BRE-01 TaxID=3069524 RepID=UPI0032FE01CB